MLLKYLYGILQLQHEGMTIKKRLKNEEHELPSR